MRKSVTIDDVARHASVARGTVSNYLTSRAKVSSDKAARIQAAIAHLGYSVNLAARGLRVNRTDIVGLVLPNITNPFYAEVARAVEHAFWENGIQTLLCDSWQDVVREQKHISALANRRVDGIVAIYSDEHAIPLKLVDSLRVPLVFADRGVEGRASVTCDNRLGGVLAARHLLELGHRRIGLLVGEPDVRNVQLRVEGFQAELLKNGLILDESLVLHGPQSLELGYRVTELLERTDPPSAVFATNDIVAIGAWQRLLKRGYRVPEDISLIGFDDIEMGRVIVPALTTIAQNQARLGSEAASLLLRVMHDEDAPVTTITVAPTLMVRDSTATIDQARASSAHPPTLGPRSKATSISRKRSA